MRLSAIKSLANHARKLGKCNFNLGDISSVKSQAYRDTSGVKPIVFKSMLEGIDREIASGESVQMMGIRDYAILRLLWDNALRCGELASLTIGDLEDSKLWIEGKGRTQKESIELSPLTLLALNSWLSVRGTSDRSAPMFIALDPCYKGMQLSERSIDRLLKKAAKKAKVTKVLSPHRIRHSSITAALDASNGDIRRVQKLSRHKNVATLFIYDDNRNNAQGEISKMLSNLV